MLDDNIYRVFTRPNWKDASCYSYTKKLNNTGWAWEFLRRNETYGCEWKSLVERTKGDIEWRIVADEFGVPNKWGLISGFISPSLTGIELMKMDKDQLFFDMACGIVSGNVGNIGHYSSEPRERTVTMRDGQIAFAFDLCLNINDQLDYAKTVLNDAQKAVSHLELKPKSIKKHKKNWPEYLRILDGRHDGCPFAKIGEIVYPGNDDPGDIAQKAYKTAKSISECGYRLIMLIRTPRKAEK